MSDDTTERPAARPGLRSRLRERIAEQRWVLVALVAVALMAIFVARVPPLLVAVGGALLLLAALVPPTRRLLVTRRRREARSLTPWPETGMKQLADALPNPCFIVDRRGITRYVNRAARVRFGDPLPGDPISLRLRVPVLLEALDKVMGGGPAQRIEWSERVPTESWLEAYVTPIAELVAQPGEPARAGAAGGAGRFVLVTLQDLTEQRRLERMRADFVANASHELRTPLASLTGFVETLQGPARDDPVARERFLSIMQQQGDRMRRLIDDLLSLSRIELKAHVQPETVLDLASLLRHACDALKPVADEADVVLDIETPPTPCPVRADRDELLEVIENLVGNAIKYGATGKKVEIRLSLAPPAGEGARTGGTFVMSVRDFGPGIAAEHLPRLTERFYRVDASRSRETKGTGLGLAIVKHILTRHKARLEIDSAPGKGAVFTARFPVAKDAELPVAVRKVISDQGVELSQN